MLPLVGSNPTSGTRNMACPLVGGRPIYYATTCFTFLGLSESYVDTIGFIFSAHFFHVPSPSIQFANNYSSFFHRLLILFRCSGFSLFFYTSINIVSSIARFRFLSYSTFLPHRNSSYNIYSCTQFAIIPFPTHAT